MKPRSRAPKRPKPRPAGPPPVYTIKVTLVDMEPPIWRRFQVTGSITLEGLHAVLQKVIGWQDSHLHEFEVAGRRYGHPVPDEPEYEVEPEWKMTLREAAPVKGRRFRYVYDLGDDWQHEIVAEAIEPPGKPLDHPVCLAGARACPPEDCGGIGGYEELLEVLADPSHPEHKEMLRWAGKGFDPEAFDVAKVNRRLMLLK